MLTNKQRNYLKSLAQKIKPTFQIGKDGISENMLTDIFHYLNKHELMKVSILNNCLETPEFLIETIKENDIEVVQLIGKTLVLYKQNKKLSNPIQIPKD